LEDGVERSRSSSVNWWDANPRSNVVGIPKTKERNPEMERPFDDVSATSAYIRGSSHGGGPESCAHETSNTDSQR
jgi:hypothetical protein